MAEVFEEYFKSGQGNPNDNNVPGTIGQFYRDLDDNNKFWKCTSRTGTEGAYIYHWELSCINFGFTSY